MSVDVTRVLPLAEVTEELSPPNVVRDLELVVPPPAKVALRALRLLRAPLTTSRPPRVRISPLLT